jgi:hypothetical protein
MKYTQLNLPSDDIGWTDESLDRAICDVMRQIDLVDAVNMSIWLTNQIKPGKDWFMGRRFAYPGGIFKRSILLSFRYFTPSTLQNAFSAVMAQPTPHRKLRNIIYQLVRALLVLFAGFLVICAIYFALPK